MQNKLAHTSEHAFIGSLQKLMGKTLNVRKVEHRDYDNLVLIAAEDIEVDSLIEAEKEVNSLISQGRRVIIHSFGSMTEAKSLLPNLRANEDRIGMNNQVRVVEIEGHDLAACVMNHAANLKECGFFLITRVNRIGSDCEINFVVSDAANNHAIDLSSKILKICTETGANYNTVEETVKKLKQTNILHLEKLRKLTEVILNKIEPEPTRNAGPCIISGIFTGLLDEQVREFASRKISESNLVVVLANLNSELDSMANVAFARSESLSNINCNRMFKEITSQCGRGGGKSNFVNGVIRRENVGEFISSVVRMVATK
jgi:alanyl-tRNA synthetase